MNSVVKRLVAVVLAFVSLCCVGGVYATWTYASNTIDPSINQIATTMGVWTEGDNEGDMTVDESSLTNRLIDVINGKVSDTEIFYVDGTPMSAQDAFNTIVEQRKDQGSYRPMNEIDGDDPNADVIKDILNIEDNTELSVVIKFVDDNSNDLVADYELYTTRVDVNAKDEGGNFIIPKDSVDKENYYIYPVNRTTFTVTRENGNLVYKAKDIHVGYSRVIWYYLNNTTKYDGNNGRDEIRTFDVTQWATGASADAENAVKVEYDIGDFYIYSDIGQVGTDNATAVYFRCVRTSWGSSSTQNFDGSEYADSPYSFARIATSGTNRQYARLKYTGSEDERPTASNKKLVHVTV
ncbi:MAG: hypothetical protein E7344_00715 [Clostridiales bacterium]|nr:hypothetical protein [Clostridiales bacterium]